VQGARSDETNKEVKLAAMRALYNSLDFVRDNFEREVTSFQCAIALGA
jgi:importin subunit beta-1